MSEEDTAFERIMKDVQRVWIDKPSGQVISEMLQNMYTNARGNPNEVRMSYEAAQYWMKKYCSGETMRNSPQDTQFAGAALALDNAICAEMDHITGRDIALGCVADMRRAVIARFLYKFACHICCQVESYEAACINIGDEVSKYVDNMTDMTEWHNQ